MNDLSLDTREVLANLNNLGYRNISAQQLKEFIKDLRKLIKYESRFGPYQMDNKTIQSHRNLTDDIGTTYRISPEKLSPVKTRTHKKIFNSRTSSPNLFSFSQPCNSPKLNNKQKSASTSITPKDYAKNVRIYKNACTSPIPTSLTGKHFASGTFDSKVRSSRLTIPSSQRVVTENTPRSSRSAFRRDNSQSRQQSQRSRSASNDLHNLKLIKIQRECNVQKPESRKSVNLLPHNKPINGDPVQLYQYYKSEWDRFKENTPGESPRTHIRWKIHQKLKQRQ